MSEFKNVSGSACGDHAHDLNKPCEACCGSGFSVLGHPHPGVPVADLVEECEEARALLGPINGLSDGRYKELRCAREAAPQPVVCTITAIVGPNNDRTEIRPPVQIRKGEKLVVRYDEDQKAVGYTVEPED